MKKHAFTAISLFLFFTLGSARHVAADEVTKWNETAGKAAFATPSEDAPIWRVQQRGVLPWDEVDTALVYQWQITGTAENQPLNPHTLYGLKNLTIQESIAYGSREYGINLVWDASNTSKNVRFERSGESYAIHVTGDGYLRYEKREYGINLVWSKTPVYEWKLEAFDGPVRTGASISIYNQVEKDHMVYCPRPYGLNVGWSKDRNREGECKSWWRNLAESILEELKDEGKEATKEAVKSALTRGVAKRTGAKEQ